MIELQCESAPVAGQKSVDRIERGFGQGALTKLERYNQDLETLVAEPDVYDPFVPSTIEPFTIVVASPAA